MEDELYNQMIQFLNNKTEKINFEETLKIQLKRKPIIENSKSNLKEVFKESELKQLSNLWYGYKYHITHKLPEGQKRKALTKYAKEERGKEYPSNQEA